MELNELLKIAEAATPGPWEVMDPSGCASWIAAKRPSRKFVGKGMSEQDAEHIATFDPETVLALLSRLEQAEQDAYGFREGYEILKRALIKQGERLEQAEQAVQRVREAIVEHGFNVDPGPDELVPSWTILEALDGDGRG